MELYSLKDISAQTIIDKLFDYCTVYGIPNYILTDRGTQFTSHVYRNFLDKFNIKDLKTNAYRPSTNGLSEQITFQ